VCAACPTVLFASVCCLPNCIICKCVLPAQLYYLQVCAACLTVLFASVCCLPNCIICNCVLPVCMVAHRISALHCRLQEAFLVLNWGAFDRILWIGVLCIVTWCVHQVTGHHMPIHNILSTAPQMSISQKAVGTLPEDGNVMSKHVRATINN
jgi:hypothetical protein